MTINKNFRRRAPALLLALAPVFASGQETQLKEVQVTSTTIDDRFESKRGEPSNISVVSGQKVDDAHAKDITQVLNSVPGVTAEVQSGDSVKIMLRGVENQRFMGEKPGVAIVIDGVPVFERTGRVNIDLSNIESIRVIKGGASYLFGEDALSGAIVITTKRGAKYAGATIATEAGSFDYYKRTARVGMAGEKGSMHLQYTDRGADDYYAQGIYGSTYLSGNGQLYLTDTSDLTIGFEKSHRNKDSHGTVTGVYQAKTDPRSAGSGRDYSRMYDVELDKLNLTYSNNYSPSGNIMLMTYQYGDHTMYKSAPQKYTYPLGANVTASDAYTTFNDQEQVQRGFKAEWRSSIDNVGWLAGLDLRANNYKNLQKNLVDYCSTKNCPKTAGANMGSAAYLAGDIRQDNDTDETMRAIYGELKFNPIKPLILTLNGRYDHIGLDYSTVQTINKYKLSNPGVIGAAEYNPAVSLSKSFNVASWRLGANYEVSETKSVYGNLSTGFRVPTVDQLFAGTASPTGKTAANPNLKPEKALNMEIGWREKSSLAGVNFDWDIALFQIDRKDYILNKYGDYGGAPGKLTDVYDNIGSARNRGIELALKTDPKREFSLDLAYTFIDAKFTNYDNFTQCLGGSSMPWCLGTPVANNVTGKLIPRVPRHQLNTTLNWHPTSAFRLGLEMDAKSWAYADEINQEKIMGRTLFNLLANYDIKEKGFMGAKWSFFGRVDNLFDKYYWVTARGSNDSNESPLMNGAYDGKYNSQDMSIVVGRGRVWTAGLSATF